MPVVSVMDIKGKTVGELKLKEEIFEAKINESLITEAVLQELAGLRTGTASTKTRADVRGGGRKPWKQKGTGRARQGSTRAPHWKGGGVVFGPHPRDFGYKLPSKVKRQALTQVLSQKVKENKIVIIDDMQLTEPKTKHFVEILENIDVLSTALVVLHKKNDEIIRSARNIKGIKLIPVNGITIHDVLKYDKLIITKDAVQQLETNLVKS